jgi:hypothetical protein
MRVAVDEPGDRTEPARVLLEHVAVERREVAHPPDRGNRLTVAEDVRVLEHVDPTEIGAAQGRVRPRRGDELRDVADQQPGHGTLLEASPAEPPTPG